MSKVIKELAKHNAIIAGSELAGRDADGCLRDLDSAYRRQAKRIVELEAGLKTIRNYTYNVDGCATINKICRETLDPNWSANDLLDEA